MMKRYFMMFSAAVAALVSCHKEPNLEPAPQPQVESHEVTIEAGILSKTVLDGNAVMWEGSDEIALVFSHETSQPHVNKTFVNQETQETVARALFRGQIPDDVKVENGYYDLGYAVYPATAVTSEGIFSHNLSSVQVAKANGSFPSECNLSSAALALSDMGEGGKTKTDFLNALSVLRIELTEDVESVTVTGTAPLAGSAPLVMDASGRLLVDANGSWSDDSKSVTLTPADGVAFESKTYNILVWPGKQEGLTISLKFRNLGEYDKTSAISTDNPVTFKPAKFYNLNVKNTEELVVEEITGKLDELEESLPNVDDLENKVDALLSQIQSVSSLTEYLDNYAEAPYSLYGSTVQKDDIELDYLVRPVSVATELVSEYAGAMSALVKYINSSGAVSFANLSLNGASMIDDVMSVRINASGVNDSFYRGETEMQLALQISDGNTSILSDFVRLAPVTRNSMRFNKTEDIPAIKGTRISIPFSFSVTSADYQIAISASENVSNPSVNVPQGQRNGFVYAEFDEQVSIENTSVTVTMTSADETISQTLRFAEIGTFSVTHDGPADYVGGEVALTVNSTLPSGPSGARVMFNIVSGGDWASHISAEGIRYNIQPQPEGGAERMAVVQFDITYQGVSFTKQVAFTQSAYGTPLSREYYSDGQWVQFQSHNEAYTPINLVIMGDGFLKKDLTPGGRFERAARSAMNAFFSIEPATTYQERFSVHMMTYASQHEGPRLTTTADSVHETAFETWYNGPDNTYVNMEDNEYGRQKVVRLVQDMFGEDGYYRTVVIMLVNSSADLGSTVYPTQTKISTSRVGDGYASFAIAMVGAYSSGMSSLVRHEGVGHGLGRLADEYLNNEVSAEDAKNTLTTEHARGYYLNVSSASGISESPWEDLAGYGDTGYWLGAWKNASVIYRPSETSIMRDSQKMYFNAVSRRIIFKRIILQTEGAIYDDDQINTMFKEYDVKNL